MEAIYIDIDISKKYIQVGAVLHLVWEQVMETKENKLADFKIDVDFVCSMVPVEEKPDGKTAATENFLMRNKIVGRGECSRH